MKEKTEILYEDQAVLAVFKPPRWVVIPDHWDLGRPSLISILQKTRPEKLYVVHRLDAGTSGAVLFAKTEQAHRFLCEQFEKRLVQKTYSAVVDGEVEQDGLIDLPLSEDPRKKGRMMVSDHGKPSSTGFRVAERFRGFTLLDASPKTGRTHQIRVHLSAIGHPLVVDPDYGGREAFFLSEIKRGYKHKQDEPDRPLISRLTLHAGEIRFVHPDSGGEMEVKAELPKDMRALLHALRKYRARTDAGPDWIGQIPHFDKEGPS
jgi:RluA family pseudouridine synthase